MPGLHSNRSRLFALVLALALTGCYSQHPLSAPVPALESRIVARLSDSGMVAMGNAIGPGAIEVEGVVAAANPEAWTLNLIRVDQRGGTSTLWNHEQVVFPRSALVNVTEKRIDRTKSWVTAGAITVGAILAARLFGAIGADSNPDTSPVPPSARRIRW